MTAEIVKFTKLQAQEKKYSIQYKVTIPAGIIESLGWVKGEDIAVTHILGGKIVIEKVD